MNFKFPKADLKLGFWKFYEDYLASRILFGGLTVVGASKVSNACLVGQSQTDNPRTYSLAQNDYIHEKFFGELILDYITLSITLQNFWGINFGLHYISPSLPSRGRRRGGDDLAAEARSWTFFFGAFLGPLKCLENMY